MPTRQLHTALITSVLLLTFGLLMAAPLASRPVQAQDSAASVHCDTTLVTLLIVAEKDYDYLSDKMMMKEPMPNIDFGPHDKLAKYLIAMMTEMKSEDAGMMHDDMMATEDAGMMHDDMMATEDAGMMHDDMMATEDASMMSGGMMMHAGDVPGEDPACAMIRADVEKFLIDHMMADMETSGM